MNGPCRRGLSGWSVRATISLPVPLSPVISTQALLGPACCSRAKISCIFGDVPTSSPKRPLVAELALQDALLARSPRVAAGAADQHFQGRRLDWLFQKPVRAQLVHGPHRRLHIAERRQHDGGRHVAGIAQPLQEPEAVQARHIEVGEDDVGGEIVEFQQRFVAVARRFPGSSPTPKPSRPARCAGWLRHLRSVLLWIDSKAGPSGGRPLPILRWRVQFGAPVARSRIALPVKEPQQLYKNASIETKSGAEQSSRPEITVRDRTRRTVLALVRLVRRRLFNNELLAQGANASSAALFAFILLLLLGTEILAWQVALLCPLPPLESASTSPAAAVRLRTTRRGSSTTDSASPIHSRPRPLQRIRQPRQGHPWNYAAQAAAAESVALGSTFARLCRTDAAHRVRHGRAVPRRRQPVRAPLRISSRLTCKQPLASMLHQTFGFDPVEQARNKMPKVPKPDLSPDGEMASPRSASTAPAKRWRASARSASRSVRASPANRNRRTPTARSPTMGRAVRGRPERFLFRRRIGQRRQSRLRPAER